MSRKFDGVDDIISNTSTTSIINSLTALTFSIWVKRNGTGDTFPRIFRKGTLTSPSGSNQYFECILDSSRSFVLQILCGWTISSNGVWRAPTDATGQFAVGEWKNLTFSFSDITDSSVDPIIYINGVIVTVTEETAPSGSKVGDADDMAFGDWGSGSRALNANLAFGQLFNRALNVNEISQIIRNPGSINKGLVGFWPLWGGSPEPDYSGNGNHGTVNNGVTLSSDNPPINGIFHPPSPNLYYSSFSTGAAPTSATGKINRVMLMGIS